MPAFAPVALAGAIGCVGLMSPHIVRRLVGPDRIGLLPTAGILGTLIATSADLVVPSLHPLNSPAG